ncbi:hypothetical protein BU16DRAFT_566989 [Lophium mytilinum]|uniref:Uncharacterized protein n=1 Tax=Lophium mytilinum TaxID=390894 RepID=A0A6A6QCS4_9PEZI|nr:hypothetical protein BU16DRAFT_566989 [Lophium mytilinum]
MASEASHGEGAYTIPSFLEIANRLGLSDEIELLNLMTTEPVEDSHVEVNTNFLDAYAIFRDRCLPRQSPVQYAAGPGLSAVSRLLVINGRKDSESGRQPSQFYRDYSVAEHYARFIYTMMEAWDTDFLDLLPLCRPARLAWPQDFDQAKLAVGKFYHLIERIRYHYNDSSGRHHIIQALEARRPKKPGIARPPDDYEPRSFGTLEGLLLMSGISLNFMHMPSHTYTLHAAYRDFREECLDAGTGIGSQFGFISSKGHLKRPLGPSADELVAEIRNHVVPTDHAFILKYNRPDRHTFDQGRNFSVLEHYSCFVWQIIQDHPLNFEWPTDLQDPDWSVRRCVLTNVLWLVRWIRSQHYHKRSHSIIQGMDQTIDRCIRRRYKDRMTTPRRVTSRTRACARTIRRL